jgi:hypothetical protein
MSFFYLHSCIHTEYMDSDEIDPPVFIHRGRKKYRRRIQIEQLDERLCRRSKRNKNKFGKSINQNDVDGIDVPVTTEVQNSSHLHFETDTYLDYHIEDVLFYHACYN